MSSTAPRLRPRGEDGGPDAAPVVTDGPFPETKELIAGWLVEAARVWPEHAARAKHGLETTRSART